MASPPPPPPPLLAQRSNDEMFTVMEHAARGLGPRLGRLQLPSRMPMDTPHYVAITSRGTVPHLTQDTFARDSCIGGVYVGLEDFIERPAPPLYQFKPSDGSSPLRRFVALPDDSLLVLGARRTPPVAAPAANPNTNTTVSVCTAVGFRLLRADDYAQAAEDLKADVVVGLGDIPYGRALGSKRIEKATDRQIDWMQDHVALRKKEAAAAGSASKEEQAKLFAPLLPVSCANQQFYMDCLAHEIASDVAGLACYSLDSLEDLPQELSHLPRLGFTTPSTPHEVLQHIARGIDVLTIPFITAATDAGIALAFSFPGHPLPSSSTAAPIPLGVDLWLSSHATDLSPLVRGCGCYACTDHHRAYIHHLLNAKEMLGWVLLQIHNHHIIDYFFAAVRDSITAGTFAQGCERFGRVYESQLPAKTGQGPRVRGYQFKSEVPGEPKKNRAPFGKIEGGTEKTLDEGAEVLAETAATPSQERNAEELAERGFAEKEP